MTQGQIRRFDVALSFAGADRAFARELAIELRKYQLSVFYDEDLRSEFWGRSLYTYLAEIYGQRADYCIVLVSAAYADGKWPKHELSAAHARSLDLDREYILPVRLDDTQMPGLFDTSAYVRVPPETPHSIAELLASKVSRERVKLPEAYSTPPGILGSGELSIFGFGPAGTGKTTLFATLSQYLVESGAYNYSFLTEDDEISARFFRSWENSLRRGIFPPPTESDEEIQFRLALVEKESGRELKIVFHEAQPESLEARHLEVREEESKLAQQVSRSTAILMFITLPAASPEKDRGFRLLLDYLIYSGLNGIPIALIVRGSEVDLAPEDESKKLIANLLERGLRSLHLLKSGAFKKYRVFPFTLGSVRDGVVMDFRPDSISVIATWLMSEGLRPVDTASVSEEHLGCLQVEGPIL